ncbi:hypothetical protein LZZ85_27185 [Terrimonas sp. NA20]|uniref:Uncharacterized protein n=1 Tax=Terrimonas ginsenosidimutans TaxID=2908004 RepID=A0ABS9L0M8_9BACT|nr:hypothetical protein [Terrimonas ginsenosidimutans]MCG2618017.1 hypothetical protein [Terrimonas ginsenosidimutans]
MKTVFYTSCSLKSAGVEMRKAGHTSVTYFSFQLFDISLCDSLVRMSMTTNNTGQQLLLSESLTEIMSAHMGSYKRRDLNDRYYQLEIFECPKEIILFAAGLGSDNVTIENFSHYGRKRADFRFEILTGELSLNPLLKKFDVDISITRIDFLRFIDVWDEQGCYAVFHDITPLKFKATDLPESQRYPALLNFGWTVEVAVPGAASDGWAKITSPNKKIIEQIEQELNIFR